MSSLSSTTMFITLPPCIHYIISLTITRIIRAIAKHCISAVWEHRQTHCDWRTRQGRAQSTRHGGRSSVSVKSLNDRHNHSASTVTETRRPIAALPAPTATARSEFFVRKTAFQWLCLPSVMTRRLADSLRHRSRLHATVAVANEASCLELCRWRRATDGSAWRRHASPRWRHRSAPRRPPTNRQSPWSPQYPPSLQSLTA